MLPLVTIEAFDRHLARLELRFEGVVIGGSALVLLGVIQRLTRDVDILAPALPEAITTAARDFARRQRQEGVDLIDDWLNNGPTQLGDVLPAAWSERVVRVFEGEALVLSTLGRPDLLKSKLFALCDRGTDWPDHVRVTVAQLGRRLGHGV